MEYFAALEQAIFEDDIVDDDNAMQEDEQDQSKVYFHVFYNILDISDDETKSGQGENVNENDDVSAMPSSSSDSTAQSEDSNDEIEWLFAENGCAVCQTCLAHLTDKKCINIHECRKRSHLVPMDKSKFMRVEFYGASTDKMF